MSRLLILKVIDRIRAYKLRFIYDDGKMSRDNIVKAYMYMAEKNGIANSIEFAWLGGAAVKKRTI